MTSIDVRPVSPADWRAYRDVRLAMLLDAPWAFGSTHADALTIDDDGWRERVSSAEYWLAWCGGDPVGSVCLSDRLAERPGEANIFGMWVDPTVRGRSIGARLVQAAGGWGKQWPTARRRLTDTPAPPPPVAVLGSRPRRAPPPPPPAPGRGG